MNLLEGMSFNLESEVNNLQIISKSKELAKKYDWLYHCTSASAFLNILKNNEFWLSNLKKVNDDEEVERIDMPEYEDKYYVCCFTYDPNIPEEHWVEYGTEKDGVLFGVKKEWFLRKAIFLAGSNQKCEDKYHVIYQNEEDAIEERIRCQSKNYMNNPFYINSFDFFQIIYDNDLRTHIVNKANTVVEGTTLSGRIITPEIAGIIKSTSGICKRTGREPYEKNWESEKEVRLKVGVQQLEIFSNGHNIHDGMIMRDAFFPKIAVPVKEDAFDELIIKFSPKFEDKEQLITKVQELLPNTQIRLI